MDKPAKNKVKEQSALENLKIVCTIWCAIGSQELMEASDFRTRLHARGLKNKSGVGEKNQTLIKAKSVPVTQAHTSQWFKVHF